ncbi:MAG: hypothetical protein L3J03_10075 [Desulfobacterales bacterium]|nr:hypothetical protein [Desulfobacterales bacterium]
MNNEIEPIVGNWYLHLGKGRDFTVVAVDEDGRGVEIQYFDGDLEELSLEEWAAMELDIREPPEDWTGPVDDVELDDLGYED